jgi:RNA polymerase sigma-70 factor, ECF subfamily
MTCSACRSRKSPAWSAGRRPRSASSPRGPVSTWTRAGRGSPPTYAEQRELVAAFAAACAEGDLERLVTLLDPDVTWRGDGGGKVASGRGAQGAERVARALILLTRRPPRRLGTATVNGAPGLVVVDADGVLQVISFTVDGGQITAIDVVRNPDKLSGVREPG